MLFISHNLKFLSQAQGDKSHGSAESLECESIRFSARNQNPARSRKTRNDQIQ
jgi:hypothetical protein